MLLAAAVGGWGLGVGGWGLGVGGWGLGVGGWGLGGWGLNVCLPTSLYCTWEYDWPQRLRV